MSNPGQLRSDLREMGFGNEQIEKAFQAGKNDLQSAVEYMISNASTPGLGSESQNEARDESAMQIIPSSSASEKNGAYQPMPLDAPTSKEEEDLKKAIEMSKHETNPGDEEIQRVIMESYEPTKTSEVKVSSRADFLARVPEDPKERKRSSFSQLVGLVNMGNTCYLNSLLQLYYSLPDFRRAIFSFRRKSIPEPESKPNSDAEKDEQESATKNKVATEQSIRFVEELQKLFAYMALGPEKFADTSGLINALFEAEGRNKAFGSEEDAHEFNLVFLNLIERAFEHGHQEENEDGSSKLVKRLFTSQFVQAIEHEGKSEEETKGETNSVIVDVGQVDKASLYDGLTEFAHATVDYSKEEVDATEPEKEDNGKVNTATKHVWFTGLAPVFCVYVGRMRYNRKSSTVEKIYDFLAIEEELVLDRYLHENQEFITEARAKTLVIQKKKSEVLAKMRTFDDFRDGDDGVKPRSQEPMLDSIARSLKRLQKATRNIDEFTLKETSKEELLRGIQILEKVYSEDAERLRVWKEEQRQLIDEENLAYQGLERKSVYRLFAVLIHSGAANSGHYWTYVRGNSQIRAESSMDSSSDVIDNMEGAKDSKPSGWIRFDDMNVRAATIDEVLLESQGGGGLIASAYAFVYLRENLCTGFSPLDATKEAQSLLPASIQELMAKSHEEFEKETATYERKKLMASLTKSAQAILDTAQTQVFESDCSPSPSRLRSLVEFILVLYPGRGPELAFVQALADAYSPANLFDDCSSSFFDHPLKKDNENNLEEVTLLQVLKDLINKQDVTGSTYSRLIPAGIQFAKRLLSDGGELMDARSHLDYARDIYIAALRRCAIIQCACEAMLEGMWSKAINLWSHTLRHGYRNDSTVRLEVFHDLLKNSNLSFLDHEPFVLGALSMTLVAATDVALEIMERTDDQDHERAVAEGLEIHTCLQTFFLDETITEVVTAKWLQGIEAVGSPENLQPLYEKFEHLADTVSVSNLPAPDDDTARALRAVEEDAKSSAWMLTFTKNYDKMKARVEELTRDCSNGFTLCAAATKLRTLVRNIDS